MYNKVSFPFSFSFDSSKFYLLLWWSIENDTFQLHMKSVTSMGHFSSYIKLAPTGVIRWKLPSCYHLLVEMIQRYGGNDSKLSCNILVKEAEALWGLWIHVQWFMFLSLLSFSTCLFLVLILYCNRLDGISWWNSFFFFFAWKIISVERPGRKDAF